MCTMMCTRVQAPYPWHLIRISSASHPRLIRISSYMTCAGPIPMATTAADPATVHAALAATMPTHALAAAHKAA